MKRKLQKEKMAQKCKFSANCSFSSKMLDYKLNSSVMYTIKWSDRKDCNFIKKIIFQETSPHFLWSHTWMNASLDFFCAVSSGQPVICLKSLASICVLTGTFWKWPRDCNTTTFMRCPCLHRWWNGKYCLIERYLHSCTWYPYLFSFPVQWWALCETSWTVATRLMEINHQRAITINNSETAVSHPIFSQQW